MSKVLRVIKIGGKVAEHDATLKAFLREFVQIKGPKILVHGGGVIATKIGEKLGIKAELLEGRRVTDRATLDVVSMVYGGLVNKKIVSALQALDVNALGLTGTDLNVILSKKRDEKPVDFGWVGDIQKVNATALLNLIESGVVPVLAPLTHDGMGNMLNTNADAIASFTAAAMSKEMETELVLCFDQPGVLNEGKVIPKITMPEYQKLKEAKIITDGMIPKLDLGFKALSEGVLNVRITAFDAVNENHKGTVLNHE